MRQVGPETKAMDVLSIPPLDSPVFHFLLMKSIWI